MFGYDEEGRLTDYTDKLGRTVVYDHDDAGRLETTTNRNGDVLSYSYDGAGRLASVSSTTTTSSEPVLRVYTYDPLRRMITGTIDGGDRYDDRGRLAHIVEATLGEFAYGYDAADRMDSLVRPNGMETAYGHDPVGRVLSIVTTQQPAGTPVHALGYTFDERGTRTDSFGTTVYTHDVSGRLTRADHPVGSPVADETSSYDEATRRTSWEGHPEAEVVYNEGDQLVQDATYTYAYDLEGQRVTRTLRSDPSQVDRYVWNVAGQMVRLEEASGEVWAYTYDAAQRRVRVETSSVARAFVYDGLLARAMVDVDAGVFEAAYVTGPRFGEVLAKVEAGTPWYATRDHLQTPVAWVSWAVSEVPRDAYGVRSDGVAGLVEPFGYTGHAEDAGGLVWGRARYLDVGVGAWLEEDPVLSTELRYGYVWATPLGLSDPTGRSSAEHSVSAVRSCVTSGVVAGGGALVEMSTFELAASGGEASNFSSWEHYAIAGGVATVGGCALGVRNGPGAFGELTDLILVGTPAAFVAGFLTSLVDD